MSVLRSVVARQDVSSHIHHTRTILTNQRRPQLMVLKPRRFSDHPKDPSLRRSSQLSKRMWTGKISTFIHFIVNIQIDIKFKNHIDEGHMVESYRLDWS
jgi:hypothetical protein